MSYPMVSHWAGCAFFIKRNRFILTKITLLVFGGDLPAVHHSPINLFLSLYNQLNLLHKLNLPHKMLISPSDMSSSN